jgi:hypothetical protein
MYKNNSSYMVWGNICKSHICRRNSNWYNPTTYKRNSKVNGLMGFWVDELGLQLTNSTTHSPRSPLGEAGQLITRGKQGLEASNWFNKGLMGLWVDELSLKLTNSPTQ